MAHEYAATVVWTRGDAPFADNRYSRGHVWRFDEGVEVPASSSPLHVPLGSITAAVDPEEAFVASLSSCHMLFFLHFAAREGFVVDRYEDRAVGVMEKNAGGKSFISRVMLRPEIRFSGSKRPAQQDIETLHHRAHENCFIANSVKSEVIVENTTLAFAD
jgi:organic hydroperoxide reductase OsmC/OhrA